MPPWIYKRKKKTAVRPVATTDSFSSEWSYKPKSLLAILPDETIDEYSKFLPGYIRKVDRMMGKNPSPEAIRERKFLSQDLRNIKKEQAKRKKKNTMPRSRHFRR